MAKPGESIENPLKGERIVWKKTGKETNGALSLFDQYLKPGGGWTAEHIHMLQDERNEVISGTATYMKDGVEYTANPGDIIFIPKGTLHTNPWNNMKEGELHLLREISPEMGIEVFFETTYGLARDGKSLPSGDAKPLQMVVLGHDLHNKTYFLTKTIPIWLQDLVLPILAAIGHLLGYKARYVEYSGPEE